MPSFNQEFNLMRNSVPVSSHFIREWIFLPQRRCRMEVGLLACIFQCVFHINFTENTICLVMKRSQDELSKTLESSYAMGWVMQRERVTKKKKKKKENKVYKAWYSTESPRFLLLSALVVLALGRLYHLPCVCIEMGVRVFLNLS